MSSDFAQNIDNTGAAKGVPPLTKPQRRVLGVLLEKAFTTPEYYPLTLKAIATGCNQKSNRSPLVNYDEDEVTDALDALREFGLVAIVHTESGRTERFRHYMRRQLTVTEPQLAVLTELLLRGPQQMGELRARASRMAPIEGQDELRQELEGLMAMDLARSSGPLDRRGVIVDHMLYREGLKPLDDSAPQSPASQPLAQQSEPRRAQPTASVESRGSSPATDEVPSMKAELQQLRLELQEMRDELDRLSQQQFDANEQIAAMRRDLGG